MTETMTFPPGPPRIAWISLRKICGAVAVGPGGRALYSGGQGRRTPPISAAVAGFGDPALQITSCERRGRNNGQSTPESMLRGDPRRAHHTYPRYLCSVDAKRHSGPQGAHAAVEDISRPTACMIASGSAIRFSPRRPIDVDRGPAAVQRHVSRPRPAPPVHPACGREYQPARLRLARAPAPRAPHNTR